MHSHNQNAKHTGNAAQNSRIKLDCPIDSQQLNNEITEIVTCLTLKLQWDHWHVTCHKIIEITSLTKAYVHANPYQKAPMKDHKSVNEHFGNVTRLSYSVFSQLFNFSLILVYLSLLVGLAQLICDVISDTL